MFRRAFTLIELLVVISIVALLSSVVLASLNTAREKARMAAGKHFDSSIKHSMGDQLLGEWLFDDSGNLGADYSGNNNIATCTTCPTQGVGYNGRGAAVFNSGSFTISDNPTLDLSDELTISFWFYPKTEYSAYALHPIEKWTDTTDANLTFYYFGQTSGQVRQIQFFGTVNGAWAALSPWFQTELNKWYHVLYTRSTAKGGQLFIDGKPIGGRLYPGVLSTNTKPLVFTVGPWVLDDIRIYNSSF